MPKKSYAKRRGVPFMVYMSPKMRDFMMDYAYDKGISLSAYIRTMLDKEIARIKAEEKEIAA